MNSTLRTAAATCALALALTLSGCSYTESSGFDIDVETATCSVDSVTGEAALQMPLRLREGLGFDAQVLGVRLNHSDGVTVEELGMLPSGVAFDEPSIDMFPVSGASLVWDLPRVTRGESATLVVLLALDNDSTEASIGSMDVVWGGGEPIYSQPLAMSVTVTDSCEVGGLSQ